MRDAARADPLGLSGLGLTVLERSGSLRAPRHRARQAAQDAHRMGSSTFALGKALTPRTRDRGGRADGTYSSLKLLDRCRRLRKPIIFITRLRLDAALYKPAPPRRPARIGRPPLKARRLPNLSVVAEDPRREWTPFLVADWYGRGKGTVEVVYATAVWHSPGLPAVPLRWVLIRDPHEEFETQALLCTDLDSEPERIISWFVRRWQMEATFQEVRQRLGFETQRHWSERAIQRTTPALLGVFSVVTLLARQYIAKGESVIRRAAWYDKSHPTFADALAQVQIGRAHV